MITYYIFLAVSVVINVLLIFAIKNLMLRSEKLEDGAIELSQEIQSLWEFIVYARKYVADTKLRMEIIDRRGGFASDDEVGTVFNRLKEAVDMLDSKINGELEENEQEESE
jgi:hypothetical protein